MKKKAIFSLISILVLSSLLIACTKKTSTSEKVDEPETKSNSESESENTYEYKELSDVSVLSVNQTFNFTDEYTSAPLYRWSNDANLPIPVPEVELLQIEWLDGYLSAIGVNENEWSKYIENMCSNYKIIESSYVDATDEEKIISNITLYDEKYNYGVNFNWIPDYVSPFTDDIYENVLQVSVHFFNQEKHNDLDSQSVLNKVFEEFGINDSKSKCVLWDITSHSNIESGYSVYYIDIPMETEIDANSILCVMRDDKIVFAEYDVFNLIIGYANNQEIEFNNDEMYILKSKNDSLASSFDIQYVYRYELTNDKFEFVKDYSVIDDLKVCEQGNIVTFQKNEDTIDLYKVEIVMKSDTPIVERYSLGEKLGTLQLE